MSDLSWSLCLDEILVDLLGLGSHFHRVLGLLEVLAGHPELDILIAELRLQEAAEGIQPVCRGKGKSVDGTGHQSCFGVSTKMDTCSSVESQESQTAARSPPPRSCLRTYVSAENSGTTI